VLLREYTSMHRSNCGVNISGKISLHSRNVIYLFMFKHSRIDYTEQGMEQYENSLAALLNKWTFLHFLFSTKAMKVTISHTSHSSVHYIFILCTV
jgi:hypothetical protein